MAALEALIVAIRLTLASVFLMAGWTKAREGVGFERTVRKFGILPGSLVSPFARGLPWVELVVAFALFTGVGLQWGAILAATMAMVFFFASLWAVLRQLNLQCDCFGLLYRERIGPLTILRDVILLLMSVSVALFDGGQHAPSALLDRSSTLTDIVVLLVTSLLLFLSARLAYRASGGFFVGGTQRR